ncbi:MAG: HAD family hydrolase [Clostridia bacterium]|jgi:HAD superfamily hydrolase (TIGR01509 family)
MRYRYAVFDMDGTLLDTMKYWRSAAFEIAKQRGVKGMTDDLECVLRKMTVRSGLEYIRSLTGTNLLDKVSFQDVLSVIEYHYRHSAEPKKGAVEFLEALAEKNIPMCVASATPGKQVEIALEKTGIRDYFDFILTPDDYPKGKHDPDIFHAVLRKFDCEAEDVALFEDALYSIKTAKALGFYIVGVEDEFEIKNKEEILTLCDEYIPEERGFIKAAAKIHKRMDTVR